MPNPPSGLATGRVDDATGRPPELDALDVFIGRWITVGETASGGEAPPVPIHASDVYEWLPGKRFVLHPAYGRFSDTDVGGVEIIGFDPATLQFRTWFFDNAGNVTTETLSQRDGIWTWQGAHTRCTGRLSADRRTLTARHERLEDGGRWVHSMTVTLKKVE